MQFVSSFADDNIDRGLQHYKFSFRKEDPNSEKIDKIMWSELFCKNCNLQFDKKHGFDLHLSLIHGEKIEIGNEPLKCKEVFQEPQTSEKLSSDHVVNRCLKCDVCDSLFKTKFHLKRHIESVHERKKPFKCNICDVSFTEMGKLNVSLVHERKKPFKCIFCDISFS